MATTKTDHYHLRALAALVALTAGISVTAAVRCRATGDENPKRKKCEGSDAFADVSDSDVKDAVDCSGPNSWSVALDSLSACGVDAPARIAS